MLTRAVAGLAVLAGCTTTVRHAVRVAEADAGDASSCYRQCQPTRAGGLPAYIGCVNACPDVSVAKGPCDRIELEAGSICVEESHVVPNVGGSVILAIVLGAGAVALTYAAFPSEP